MNFNGIENHIELEVYLEDMPEYISGKKYDIIAFYTRKAMV